jgi:transcriptional regulator with XRE-family HTH domain
LRETAGGAELAPPAECSDDRPPSQHATDGPASVVPELEPGARLQARREELGLTLDDISRTTKISKGVLRALEAGNVVHLPAPIYTRAFVRSYAQEVGLPAEATADTYLHHLTAPPTPVVTPEDIEASADGASLRMELSDEDAREQMVAVQVQRITKLAIAAAAAGFVIYLATFPRDEGAMPVRIVDAAESSDVLRAGGPIDESTAPVEETIAGSAWPLRVELAPQGPCWVSVRVGGETILAKLLQAGDRETLDLADEAVVRIGEPGALSFSINGQSGRSLGPAGQPVTVRIGKDNFRDFLSS